MWVNIDAISTISECEDMLTQGGLQRSSSPIEMHNILLIEGTSRESGHGIAAELRQSNWDPRARESHSGKLKHETLGGNAWWSFPTSYHLSSQRPETENRYCDRVENQVFSFDPYPPASVGALLFDC